MEKRAKSNANRFLVPENGIYIGIRRFYVKKRDKIAIFLRFGVKNPVFFHFKGLLWVKKFFWRQNRVFQLFLPLEMMLLEKKFFRKNGPQKFQKYGFFCTTLY